jgi:hypothetical protein
MHAVRYKIVFVLLVIALPLLVALYLAEFVAKKIEYHRRAQVVDYGQVKRLGKLGKGGFLNQNLTTYVSDGLGGKVRWTNNADGFRNDREFGPYPPPHTLRILSLGDSFTAGYRVGQEQTFSYLLEQWLNRNLGPAEVMVSEIEEPAKALYYLNEYGLGYHPDIVLLGITLGNDIAQNYLSLDPKGVYKLTIDHDRVTIEPQTVDYSAIKALNDAVPAAYLERESYLQHKWHDIRRGFTRLWLMRGLYKDREGIISAVDAETPPKLFDCGNGLGIYLKPSPPPIDAAYQRLFRVISAIQTVCQQHHIIFAVEIFPQRFQVQPPDWDSAVDKYRLKKSAFDLMEPNNRIGQYCAAHRIICIDPTQAMAKHYAETGQKMYLPFGDMHWNQAGQRAFFAGALPTLEGMARAGFQEIQARRPQGFPGPALPPVAGDGQPSGLSPGTQKN